MRNYIVYFLNCLFLLFMVESKVDVKTLRNDYTSHTSHMPKKTNRLNQTYEKLSAKQFQDFEFSSSIEITEEDFQFSDSVRAVILLASIFSIVYTFGLKAKKQLKPNLFGFSSQFSTVRRFIFIHSIRI